MRVVSLVSHISCGFASNLIKTKSWTFFDLYTVFVTTRRTCVYDVCEQWTLDYTLLTQKETALSIYVCMCMCVVKCGRIKWCVVKCEHWDKNRHGIHLTILYSYIIMNKVRPSAALFCLQIKFDSWQLSVVIRWSLVKHFWANINH